MCVGFCGIGDFSPIWELGCNWLSRPVDQFLGFVIVKNKKKTFSGFGGTVYALTLTSFGTWTLFCFGEKASKAAITKCGGIGPKESVRQREFFFVDVIA